MHTGRESTERLSACHPWGRCRTGTATLGGDLTLTGNLTVSGASANLNLGGKTVSVTGDFNTQSSGKLTMTNALDALTVTGNVTFDGSNTSTLLSAGQLTLQGNFSQGGSSTSFAASGTHAVLFNGSGAQTISFGSPSFTSSRFQDVTFAAQAQGCCFDVLVLEG